MMNSYDQYRACIEACCQCATMSNNCASSCTQESDIQTKAMCIQLCMECATICYSTAQLMSLGSKKAKELCRICAEICDTCCTECSKHSCEHCQACASACKTCAEECRKIAAKSGKLAELSLES